MFKRRQLVSMSRKGIAWGIAAFVLIALTTCNVDDDVNTPEEQLAIDLANVDQTELQIDLEIIDQYLADSGITAQKDPSGLRYVIHEQGNGLSPELLDAILVGYEGKLLSGTVF